MPNLFLQQQGKPLVVCPTPRVKGSTFSPSRFSGDSVPKGILKTAHHWFSPEAFKILYNVHDSDYVGKVPPSLLLKNNPNGIYTLCDELSTFLEPLNGYSELPPFKVTTHPEGQELEIHRIRGGGNGTVYKIISNGQPFVLKIFHKLKWNLNVAMGEISRGLYFHNEHFKDLAHFEFANPKAPWAMFEFISKEMTPENREGISYSTRGIYINDDYEGNNINGIRVDYSSFKKAPKTIAIEDFNRAMETNNPVIQAEIASQIKYLPEENRTEAFNRAMETGDPAVQAAAISNLFYLPGSNDNEFKLQAFERAMVKGPPDVQVAAISRVGSFPAYSGPKGYKHRLWAFNLAMSTDNPKVQAAAVLQISMLPAGERITQAFKQAMDTGHPEVQAAVASQIRALPEGDDRVKAFKQAMGTDHPEVQIAAVSQIYTLPKGDDRVKAFKQAMDTGHPEVQAAVASQIYTLPKGDDRVKAFKQAMGTDHPEVQIAVVSQIKHLPKKLGASVSAQYFQDYWHSKDFDLSVLSLP